MLLSSSKDGIVRTHVNFERKNISINFKISLKSLEKLFLDFNILVVESLDRIEIDVLISLQDLVEVLFLVVEGDSIQVRLQCME